MNVIRRNFLHANTSTRRLLSAIECMPATSYYAHEIITFGSDKSVIFDSRGEKSKDRAETCEEELQSYIVFMTNN